MNISPSEWIFASAIAFMIVTVALLLWREHRHAMKDPKKHWTYFT